MPRAETCAIRLESTTKARGSEVTSILWDAIVYQCRETERVFLRAMKDNLLFGEGAAGGGSR